MIFDISLVKRMNVLLSLSYLQENCDQAQLQVNLTSVLSMYTLSVMVLDKIGIVINWFIYKSSFSGIVS